MSGHCRECGVYHEEDDDRLCASCLPSKEDIATTILKPLEKKCGGSEYAAAWLLVNSALHEGQTKINDLRAQLTATRLRCERLACECRAWRKVSEIQAQRDDDERRYAAAGQTYSWGDLNAATSAACAARTAVDSHNDLETPC